MFECYRHILKRGFITIKLKLPFESQLSHSKQPRGHVKPLRTQKAVDITYRVRRVVYSVTS